MALAMSCMDSLLLLWVVSVRCLYVFRLYISTACHVMRRRFKEIWIEEVAKAQGKVAEDQHHAVVPACHHSNITRVGSNRHVRRATCRDCGHIVSSVHVT